MCSEGRSDAHPVHPVKAPPSAASDITVRHRIRQLIYSVTGGKRPGLPSQLPRPADVAPRAQPYYHHLPDPSNDFEHAGCGPLRRGVRALFHLLLPGACCVSGLCDLLPRRTIDRTRAAFLPGFGRHLPQRNPSGMGGENPAEGEPAQVSTCHPPASARRRAGGRPRLPEYPAGRGAGRSPVERHGQDAHATARHDEALPLFLSAALPRPGGVSPPCPPPSRKSVHPRQ